MKKNPAPTYRGELFPRLDKLTDAQISDRLREAAKIDEALNSALDDIPDADNPDRAAAIKAYRTLLDIGLASIAVAEHRVEVQFFTRAVVVKKKGARRGR